LGCQQSNLAFLGTYHREVAFPEESRTFRGQLAAQFRTHLHCERFHRVPRHFEYTQLRIRSESTVGFTLATPGWPGSSSGELIVKSDPHRLLEILRHFASGFLDPTDQIHGRPQTRARRSLSHQADDRFQSVEEHALTRSGDVRKEAAFDRIAPRTVTGIVGHADLETPLVDQVAGF